MTGRAQQTVELEDGRRLAYVDWFDAGSRPVVLFHGAPGSRLFLPDRRVVADLDVRLITFDRPGYGGSDRHEGRELIDTTRDVEQLVGRLGIGRFAVLGVSAGGPHALACAAALTARIDSIGVASAPGPLDEVPGAWDALAEHQRPTAAMARREPHRSARAITRYMQHWIDDPATYLGDSGPPADRAAKRDPRYRPMLLDDVAEAFRGGAGGIADDLIALWRPWGFDVSRLPNGAHLWHGAQDTRARPDFDYLTQTMPHARVTVWPDLGHYGVLARWRAVLSCIADGDGAHRPDRDR